MKRLTISLIVDDDHPFLADPHDYLRVTAVDVGVLEGPSVQAEHASTYEDIFGTVVVYAQAPTRKFCGFCRAELTPDGTKHAPPYGEHEEPITIVEGT